MRTSSREYRYTFAKDGIKHVCPSCKKKRFVRYVDNTTRSLLPERYGKCDRSDNCGYSLNPYTDKYTCGSRTPYEHSPSPNVAKDVYPSSHLVHLPLAWVRTTTEANRYKDNTFIQNLLSRVPYPFDVADVEHVVGLYWLGTIASEYMRGAVTFPFIDKDFNPRAVSVMHYDKANHRQESTWLHSVIAKNLADEGKPIPTLITEYKNQTKKVTCLFGEHLLRRYPNNPVAVVESPKTAITAMLYFGMLDTTNENPVWVATGGKGYFTAERLSALQGRRVMVFPDLSPDGGTFREWKSKATQLNSEFRNTSFTVSDYLERKATNQDRTDGLDLADFLIRFDWREFRKEVQGEVTKTAPCSVDNAGASVESETQLHCASPTVKGLNVSNVDNVDNSSRVSGIRFVDIGEWKPTEIEQTLVRLFDIVEIRGLPNKANQLTKPNNERRLHVEKTTVNS